MGSVEFPYQSFSTWMKDAKEETHQLSQRISHLYATWEEKHHWCAVVILTLVVIVLSLAQQVPEVCPETDRKLLDENSEMRKEISALKMDAIGKEKAKLGEEGQALRRQLADTTQHLEKARMGLEDFHGWLDAMNQTLSKTWKQLEGSTRQEQMQVDLELNGKLKEALRQRDACHTQLEEKIMNYAELKNQQAENEKLKEEIKSVQRQLQNVEYARWKCQYDVYRLEVRLKSECHRENFQNYEEPWMASAVVIIIIIWACVIYCIVT